MNRIELTNFRVFKETTAFDLAPITILTGKNNSGKSSLIKAFLVLADYLELGTNQRFLSLNGPRANKHKLPDYSKVKNWSSELLQTTFKFQNGDCQFEIRFGGEKESLSPQLRVFHFDYLNVGKGLHLERTAEGFYLEVSQQFITAFVSSSNILSSNVDTGGINEHVNVLVIDLRRVREELRQIRNEKSNTTNKRKLVALIDQEQQLDLQQRRLDQQIRELESRPNNESIIYQVDIPFQDEEDSALSIPGLIRLGLSRYIQEQQRDKKSSFRYSSGDDQQFFRFADRLRRTLLLSVAHLSPNRTHQARLYYAHDRQTEINDIINEFARLKIPEGSPAGIFLKKWLNEFGIGEKVIVTPVKGEASSIELVQAGRKIDLADMGFGTGQLLTLLLKIASIIHSRRGFVSQIGSRERIVLIEEPESNLHPKLQSVLANLFLEACLAYDIQFILETHSEYLIREVQVLVKALYSGEYQPRRSSQKQRHQNIESGQEVNPFKVYYFDDILGRYEMRFREDGKFIDEFGSGFFDESRNLFSKLIKTT